MNLYTIALTVTLWTMFLLKINKIYSTIRSKTEIMLRFKVFKPLHYLGWPVTASTWLPNQSMFQASLKLEIGYASQEWEHIHMEAEVHLTGWKVSKTSIDCTILSMKNSNLLITSLVIRPYHQKKKAIDLRKPL